MATPQFVLELRKKIGHAEPSSVQPCGLYVGEVSGYAAKDRGTGKVMAWQLRNSYWN